MSEGMSALTMKLADVREEVLFRQAPRRGRRDRSAPRSANQFNIEDYNL